MSLKAALYARSSKDRSDVSPDAQLRKLRELAAADGAAVIAEYVDAVEQADDWGRPGFAELLTALDLTTREWTTLYVYDTARIAREDDFLRATFNHKCRRQGITVRYALLPTGGNPLMELMVTRTASTYDAMHSMISREKGLAGMRENVLQGWRAGGRAPRGYRLRHVPTGAIRDGVPVTKSRLELAPDAGIVGGYLKLRAQGIARIRAIAVSGIALQDTTLIGMEWNALTYAGHTVWNQERAKMQGGYVGGRRRRPRSEWVIRRDTHTALISDGEAEAILARLEASAIGRRRRSPARYLLTGLLVTPDGHTWQGNATRYYRVPGRQVLAETLERAVLGKLVEDLRAPHFIKALLRDARKAVAPDPEIRRLEELHGTIDSIDRRIHKLTTMLQETDAHRPLLEAIEKLEQERGQLQARVIQAETGLQRVRCLAAITEADVVQILDDLARRVDVDDRELLKDCLAGMIERITLDPATMKCRIHYQIAADNGAKLATPRGADLNPVLRAWSQLRLAA